MNFEIGSRLVGLVFAFQLTSCIDVSLGQLKPGSSKLKSVPLLKDTQFAESYGAAFIYGKKYSGGRRPPLGKLHAALFVKA